MRIIIERLRQLLNGREVIEKACFTLKTTQSVFIYRIVISLPIKGEWADSSFNHRMSLDSKVLLQNVSLEKRNSLCIAKLKREG